MDSQQINLSLEKNVSKSDSYHTESARHTYHSPLTLKKMILVALDNISPASRCPLLGFRTLALWTCIVNVEKSLVAKFLLRKRLLNEPILRQQKMLKFDMKDRGIAVTMISPSNHPLKNCLIMVVESVDEFNLGSLSFSVGKLPNG